MSISLSDAFTVLISEPVSISAGFVPTSVVVSSAQQGPRICQLPDSTGVVSAPASSAATSV